MEKKIIVLALLGKLEQRDKTIARVTSVQKIRTTQYGQELCAMHVLRL